MPEMRHLKMV